MQALREMKPSKARPNWVVRRVNQTHGGLQRERFEVPCAMSIIRHLLNDAVRLG